jgi:hypothetical protein
MSSPYLKAKKDPALGTDKQETKNDIQENISYTISQLHQYPYTLFRLLKFEIYLPNRIPDYCNFSLTNALELDR